MKSKKLRDEQIAKETAEQLGISPLGAGERFRAQLGMEVDKQLQHVSKAAGDDEINRALLVAMDAHRRYVAFSHDLAVASGRRVYEVRSTLSDKMGSEYFRRRVNAMRGPGLPPVVLPELAREIIAAVKAAMPPKPGPRIFESEQEWQQYLRDNNLTEAHAGYIPEETASERRQRGVY